METTMTKQTETKITINSSELKQLRAKTASNWKTQIIEYLKANNGASSLDIYNSTRPDRLDITEAKKVHNVASQLTYLRDEGYILQNEDKQVFLLAAPTTVKDEYEVIHETKLKSLLRR
jgi:hypothetical protein